MRHYDLKYEFRNLRILGYNKDFTLGYAYDAKNRCVIEFPTADNRLVLETFEKLSDYIGLPTRTDKYLKVYKIWESLGVKPDLAWRAIRVSISHSKRQITQKNVAEFLLSNFGELEISFKRSGQSALFYKFFAQLVEATYAQLLTKLAGSNRLDGGTSEEIVQRLDVIRSIRKSPRLYYYEEPEEELMKYIPNRVGIPVAWGKVRQGEKHTIIFLQTS